MDIHPSKNEECNEINLGKTIDGEKIAKGGQDIATSGHFYNIIGGILNNCAHEECPRRPSMT